MHDKDLASAQWNSVQFGVRFSYGSLWFSIYLFITLATVDCQRAAAISCRCLFLGDVLIIVLFVLFFFLIPFSIYVPDLIMQINSNGSFLCALSLSRSVIVGLGLWRSDLIYILFHHISKGGL